MMAEGTQRPSTRALSGNLPIVAERVRATDILRRAETLEEEANENDMIQRGG